MSVDPAAGPGPDEMPASHADPDRLADLAEGLLSAPDTASAHAHLASCPACADDFALISGSLDLAALLPAEPIPAEVAIRVQAALDREPALGSAVTDAASAPAPVRSPRRRFRIALTGLAGLCLLGVVAVGATSALRSAIGQSESKSAGTAAAGPALPSSAGGLAPLTAGAPVDDAATAQQFAAQLLRARPALSSPDDAAGSTGGSVPDNGQSGSAYRRCLPLAQASRTPLASAPVTFRGQPAQLLVFRQASGSAEADVVVVPASCAAPQSAVAGGASPEATASQGSTGSTTAGALLTTTVPIP